MADYPKELFEAALKLSPEARSSLAEDLLDTVDTPEVVEQAWKREIEERLGRMDRGEGKTISWEEARKQIFARLKDA